MPWHPVHEKHSIAMMAAKIAFSGEVTDIASTRIIKAAHDAASRIGLSSATPIQMVEFNPGTAVSSQFRQHGFVFTSLEQVPKVPGMSIDFARQLQVDRESIGYRTSTYTRWASSFDDMKNVFAPLLDIASQVINIKTIRLEYLDRFTSDGTEDALAELLDPKSPYIAPHVFSAPGNWHSHTGYADSREPDGSLRIAQIHIDHNFMTHRATRSSRQLVGAMTAREYRNPFRATGDSGYTPDDVLSAIDQMHHELKNLVGAVLTTDAKQMIGLEESVE